MRLSTYLARHTVGRWIENPWSPMARLTVATLMSVMLVSSHCLFEVSEKMLRERLSRSGVNTIVANRFVFGSAQTPLRELFSGFERLGDTLSLHKINDVATTDSGARLAVYGYDDALTTRLAASGVAAGATQAIIRCRQLPVGLTTRAHLNGRSFEARIAAPGSALESIPDEGVDGVLLVPSAFITEIERERGFTDVWILKKTDDSVSVPQVTETIEILNRADRLGVYTMSAAGVLRQMEELEHKRAIVVPAFVMLTALIITAVFGALSILEHRDNRFIFALLRSMGAPSRALLLQYSFESLAVALAGGACAIALIHTLCAPVATTLGMPEVVPWVYASLLHTGILSTLAITLACAVALSCLPIIPGLRKPIGRILS